MACGKGYEVHRGCSGSPGERTRGCGRGGGKLLPISLRAQHTRSSACIHDTQMSEFFKSKYLCTFCDTVYSNVYSPVYFSFQLTPAQMKLTSDPSCPNEVSR